MLIAPHFLVGAAIAVYAPEALPAAGLAALTSHFVLDSIPHRDMIGEIHITPSNVIMELFDAVVAAVLFIRFIPESLRTYALLIGGVAILPDLLALPSLFFPRWYQLPVVKQLHNWHTKTLQANNQKMNWFWGLLLQVLVAIAAVYLIVTKPL